MKVLVGSKNPVKINAVKIAFSKYFDNFEIEGIDVPSNVADQPYDNDTHIGAENRALELKKINKTQNLNADFFVGIESGILKTNSKWLTVASTYIIDKNENKGIGLSPAFELPNIIIKGLKEGKELGTVADEILNETNVKQNSGTIGHLTKDIINRETSLSYGTILALIPFINLELFKK